MTFHKASNDVLIYGEGRLQVIHHLLKISVLALQIRDLQGLLVLCLPHGRLCGWVIVAEVAGHVGLKMCDGCGLGLCLCDIRTPRDTIGSLLVLLRHLLIEAADRGTLTLETPSAWDHWGFPLRSLLRSRIRRILRVLLGGGATSATSTEQGLQVSA